MSYISWVGIICRYNLFHCFEHLENYEYLKKIIRSNAYKSPNLQKEESMLKTKITEQNRVSVIGYILSLLRTISWILSVHKQILEQKPICP